MNIPVEVAPLAYALLILIPMVSLYGLFMDQSFVQSGLFHMGAVMEGQQYHRLLTSAFLHGDIMHLVFNMMTFFFFGPPVEAIFGTGGLLAILLLSQAGANALTIIRKRTDRNYAALGASGAVSGVLLAFCAVAPTQIMYFFVIPMPAWVFAIFYLAYSSFAMGGTGRIAHEAHLGGAIAGGALGLLLTPQIQMVSG